MQDSLLESLVSLVESEDVSKPLEIDVTLIVSGFLVSGFMVSEKMYRKLNPTTRAMDTAAKRLLEKKPHLLEDLPEPDTNPKYIHLRQTSVHVPGQDPIPSNQEVFSRFKIEAVSGFIFGLIQSDSLPARGS